MTVFILPLVLLASSTLAAMISFSRGDGCVCQRSGSQHCHCYYLLSRLEQVNSMFFEEFLDLVKLVASRSALVFIVGDMNIHLDDTFLITMMNFMSIIFGCDKKQRVKEQRHRAGHTLDIVHSSTVATVSVDLPYYSFINVVANVGSATKLQAINVSKRNWSNTWHDVSCKNFDAYSLGAEKTINRVDSGDSKLLHIDVS